MVAPILGSQLLTFTSWRGIFVTLALIGVVLFSASAFGLSETLPLVAAKVVASLPRFRPSVCC
jgi:hypothetical protein